MFATGVKEAIYGQTIAGLFFALVGGQAMVVLLTTAPLAIYTKSKIETVTVVVTYFHAFTIMYKGLQFYIVHSQTDVYELKICARLITKAEW